LARVSLVDVCRLVVEGRKDTAGLGLEHILALGVADAPDHLAGDFLHVEVGFGLDFAGQHDLPSGDERLAGNLAAGVKGEEIINERVRNLIGNFVGVSFGDRFGGEQIRHSASRVW
jgi:hypothetical protein